MNTDRCLLTLNAGSSSLKYGVYEVPDSLSADPVERLRGNVEGIQPGGHADALAGAMREVRTSVGEADFVGVGHRIAHGGVDLRTPQLLDDDMLVFLRSLEPLAPLHQPNNLAGVEASRELFADAVQVGCFDTAFHRDHPWINDTFALPREWYERGARRYGFHGLSYEYVTGALAVRHPELAEARTVICHLGNGASMCAVSHGRSVASTMGFSALDGLPMGTRCGNLGPGVVLWMIQTHGLSAAEVSDLLYNRSGLAGLSGMGNDMRELEKSERPAAREAIDYFVFRIRRELGALAATLGGLDAVVFCGGIGEHSAHVRSRVCSGMEWLGVSLDAEANAASATTISQGDVRVLVIPTNEELVIARAVAAAIR